MGASWVGKVRPCQLTPVVAFSQQLTAMPMFSRAATALAQKNGALTDGHHACHLICGYANNSSQLLKRIYN
jgi:hypothetical protein